MRTVLIPSLVAGLLLAGGSFSRADDIQAILDKAIKAHGGAEKVAKPSTVQTKSKGTIEILGGIAFTEEATIQPPGQLKSVVQIEVMGQNVTVTTVFDRDKGWVQAGGKNMDMDEKLIAVMKDQLYMMSVAKLTALKDKKDDVSLIGDDKVDGRDVVGVRVAPKDHKEISLYFDKKTGLLAKLSWRTTDQMTGQEIGEERIIQEYQELDGLQVAKKVLINHDGKKFIEAEVLEVKLVDKVDDSTFAKP
jgi:hypothetical protein